MSEFKKQVLRKWNKMTPTQRAAFRLGCVLAMWVVLSRFTVD